MTGSSENPGEFPEGAQHELLSGALGVNGQNFVGPGSSQQIGVLAVDFTDGRENADYPDRIWETAVSRYKAGLITRRELEAAANKVSMIEDINANRGGYRVISDGNGDYARVDNPDEDAELQMGFYEETVIHSPEIPLVTLAGVEINDSVPSLDSIVRKSVSTDRLRSELIGLSFEGLTYPHGAEPISFPLIDVKGLDVLPADSHDTMDLIEEAERAMQLRGSGVDLHKLMQISDALLTRDLYRLYSIDFTKVADLGAVNKKGIPIMSRVHLFPDIHDHIRGADD